jgi:meso-butanediol dehydrogenase/(S,S)-butanediol dehydrogenase/diacetyl reductase
VTEARDGSSASRQGKRVLIAGGGSGIGAATAVYLARGGWMVEIADIAPPEGGRYLDAGDETSWKEVIDAVWPLDALVNCAGIRDRGPLTELSVAQFERMMAVHATGGFVGIRETARRWQAEGRPGAVVSMASVNATHAVADQAHYAAAKAAVAGLTRAAAVELADSGIRVNAIAPGLIRTPMTEIRFADPAGLKSILSRVPMGRAGQPTEIAAAVAFLLADEASYITGVTLPVDGGWMAC